MAHDVDKRASRLLHRRPGDDPEQRKALEQLVPIRDRVLDNGDTMKPSPITARRSPPTISTRG